MKYNHYDPAKNDLTVVCMKSFILGIVLAVCGCTAVFTTSRFWFKLSIYIGAIAIFHLLEFLSTALYNNSQTDDDSFILSDTDLHLANGATVVEYVVTSYFLDDSTAVSWSGLVIFVVAQFFRTAAMITAGESFNHYIQKEHKDDHKLVTSGIYSVVRHPSYFGFFWWVIGLRLWLNTYITLILGAYKIWKFFKTRINYEELFLVDFFGDDYLQYRKKTTHSFTVGVTVHQNTVVAVDVLAPSGRLPQRNKHVLVGESVVLAHDSSDGSRGFSSVVEGDSRAVVVQDVGLNDVVEQEGANPAELSVDGSSGTSSEVPLFGPVMRHGWVGMLQKRDEHEPVVDEDPRDHPVDQ